MSDLNWPKLRESLAKPDPIEVWWCDEHQVADESTLDIPPIRCSKGLLAAYANYDKGLRDGSPHCELVLSELTFKKGPNGACIYNREDDSERAQDNPGRL